MFKAPSKIIFKSDKKKEWEIHQQKIQNVKCSVDHHNSTNSIVRYKHNNLFQNLELQNSNNVHVKRLVSIQANTSMRTFNLNYSISATHHNRTSNNSITAAGNITTTKNPHLGTLHQGFFKKQKQKIDQDNQAFYRRIQDTRSIFDVKKWAHEAEERKKILLVRSEYPQYYSQNINGKDKKGSHDKTNSAFNYGSNNLSIRADGSKIQEHFEKSGSAKENGNNMSAVLKDQSIIEMNNQSLNQIPHNTNNESINFIEQPSIIANNNQELQDKKKFVVVSNITVPSNFYHTMQSDTERTNYLKKLIRESRKVLYRKTAEIQDDTFFAEIKIESGQFKIELENAKGEVYKHAFPEEEGLRFFQKECMDDVHELFKRIKLNKLDKTITLQKQKLVVSLQPIELKTAYKFKSMNQTKNFNSTEMLSKEEIYESDEDQAEESKLKVKQNANNKSLDENDKSKNQHKSKDRQISEKNRLKSTSPNSKETIKKIVSKNTYSSQAIKEQKEQTKKPIQQQLQQRDQQQPAKLPNQQQQQQQKPKAETKTKLQNQQKTVKQQQNKQNQNQKQNTQSNKNQTTVNNQKQINQQSKNKKEEPEDDYENDYDEFDDDIEEEEEKKGNHNQKEDKQKNENNQPEEEYDDPFDKFDEEEELKKKEEIEKSPVMNQQQTHPHEELNKKMNRFSFNNTGYKKNVSQESFQSKQNQNSHIEQHKVASPISNKPIAVENKKEEEKISNKNQPKEEDQSIEYDDEFEQEEDSGTQYEINDADKEILSKQNLYIQEVKQHQEQKKSNQNNEKKKLDENKDEEYEADFD